MTTYRFSSYKDALYFRRRSAEKARLYYPPLRWLVNDDTLTLNLYGEPGEPLSGSDGITSVAATRRLVSATADFVTSGVQVSDILEVISPASNDGDNGRYQVNSVVDLHTLEITENWPVGGLTALTFYIHFLKERYTEFEQLVPVQVKLRPTEKMLDKFGIQEKRDASLVLSIHLCEELGLTPKIGDRFIYPYGYPSMDARNIHYEVKNLYEETQLTNSGVPIDYIGFATRTTNKRP